MPTAAMPPNPASSQILYGLPRDVATDGPVIDWMLHFTVASITVLFLVMLIWLLYSCVAHGRRHTAAHFLGDTPKAAIGVVGLALAIFAFVDGNLFVRTIHELDTRLWNFRRVDGDPTTLRVEINAQQWAWTIRYAGADGRFNTDDDVTTTNDLRVPVGHPILVQLGSTDVIHSFYLPNFRVKQDAVPGQINETWFEATEPGQFEIGCAQHCGVNHYKMRGTLTVMRPADFQAWLATSAAEQASLQDPTHSYGRWGWDWQKGI